MSFPFVCEICSMMVEFPLRYFSSHAVVHSLSLHLWTINFLFHVLLFLFFACFFPAFISFFSLFFFYSKVTFSLTFWIMLLYYHLSLSVSDSSFHFSVFSFPCLFFIFSPLCLFFLSYLLLPHPFWLILFDSSFSTLFSFDMLHPDRVNINPKFHKSAQFEAQKCKKPHPW